MIGLNPQFLIPMNTVKRISKEALDAGINPIDLIEQGFVTGMKEIGDIFDAGEFQLRQIFKAYHIV